MGATRPSWRAIVVLTLTCSPALAQTLPPPKATPASTAGGVAATVNGQPIFEAVVERNLQGVPPEKRGQVRPDLIQHLVDNLLIEQYLQQLQVQVEKTDVDKRIDEMKEMFKKQGKEYAKALESMKITENDLRDWITADLRWDKFAATQATDKVLHELFDGNKEMFDGTTVRARHILVQLASNDPKAAEAALAKLQGCKQKIDAQVTAGLAKLAPSADNLTREKTRTTLLDEAFSAAAKECSDCPTKMQGGDVGWFRQAGFMVEPFAKAAFSLPPYQMSEPVKTQFGYHLILVTDRKPGGEVKFEQAKEMAKEIFSERLREKIAGDARKVSKIEIVTPKP
jgi:peptidyl-prolyl cis-trans isomerase C